MIEYECEVCEATAEEVQRIVKAILTNKPKKVKAAIMDLIELGERLAL